jgi:hypothetical protein
MSQMASLRGEHDSKFPESAKKADGNWSICPKMAAIARTQAGALSR